jgi:hypothetical protein
MKRANLILAVVLLCSSAGAQVVAPVTAECATSIDGSVVSVLNPLNPPIVVAAFSGMVGSGNYFVEIVWYDAAGHVTLPSPEVQVQLSATGSIQVSPPAPGLPSSAVGMQVFIGSTSGSETLQGSTTGATTFIQSVPLISGTPPPTVNNTVCQVIANDAGWPTGTGYNVAITTQSGDTLPGYPAQWQLLGPGNTINLGQGTPLYNGTVTFPSPILALPYGHAQQSIAGPLTLGNYGLTAGSLTVGGPITAGGPILAPGLNNIIFAELYPGLTPDAQITAALADAQPGQEIWYQCPAGSTPPQFAARVVVSVAVTIKLGGCRFEAPPSDYAFEETVPGIHLSGVGKLQTYIFSSANTDVIHVDPSTQNDWDISNITLSDNIVSTRTAGAAIHEDTGIDLVNTQNGTTGGCSSNCVTFVSGNLPFTSPGLAPASIINIAGSSFTVASVVSGTVLSLTAPPGTQSGVILTSIQASLGSVHDVLTFGFINGLLVQGMNDSLFYNIRVQSAIHDSFYFQGPGNTTQCLNCYALGVNNGYAGFRFYQMNQSGITGGQCSVNNGNCVVSQGSAAYGNTGFWLVGLDAEVGGGYSGSGDGILFEDVGGWTISGGDAISNGGSGIHCMGGGGGSIAGISIFNNKGYAVSAAGASPLGNVCNGITMLSAAILNNTLGNYNDPNGVIVGNVGIASGFSDGGWVVNNLVNRSVLFATLPSCASSLTGRSYVVTDSTTATYNATVTGSGSNTVIALCNGSNWTAH